MGQGQRSRSNFWRIEVDIRGSALPSATKSKEESLSVQGVCMCAEQSRGRVNRLLILCWNRNRNLTTFNGIGIEGAGNHPITAWHCNTMLIFRKEKSVQHHQLSFWKLSNCHLGLYRTYICTLYVKVQLVHVLHIGLPCGTFNK